MKNQIGYMMFFASIAVACWAMRTSLDREVFAEARVVTSVADLAVPLVESGKVAGLSIGIVSMDPSGQWKSESHHYGTATGSNTSPDAILPTDDTLYEIGGMTNLLTGILLASAVERGEVRLDTPAAELMPLGVTMPSFEDRQITLLDMVTHRSGLPRLANNMPRTNADDPYHDYTSQLAGEFLNQHKLTRPPGTQYEYSNFAMSYLGYLLSHKFGADSYDALLADRLTGLLQMTSTKAQLAESDSRLAVGHRATGREAAPWYSADMPGAGGVRSTISDMNRFMIANLEPRQNELGRAIDLAFEQHEAPFANDHAMGLGWLIARDGSTRFHNGQTGGFHSAMFVSRELNLGVCVLSNTASGEVDTLASQLLRWKAGIEVTVPAMKMSRRDGAGYPKLSPFSAIRWRDQIPVVQVDGTWYELVALNELTAAKMISFSQKTFGNLWQKRFEEDLVELLTRMGHIPQSDVTLVLKALDSGTTTTLKQVAMTWDNRQAIYRAALSR